MDGDKPIPAPRIGAMVVGDKGVIVHGSHGARDWQIYPKSKMKEYMQGRKRVPEPKSFGPPGNLKHIREWLAACQGWKTAGSNFDYGGPLSELAMLGNIAMLTPGTELQGLQTHDVPQSTHRESAPAFSVSRRLDAVDSVGRVSRRPQARPDADV